MTLRFLATVAVAATLLPFAQKTEAATFSVCASGCDFTSIQSAHTAAAANDVIDVLGTITESPILLSKTLTILSSLPSPQIVQAHPVEGAATDRVFYLFGSADIRMENLIIRHGNFQAGIGGGIFNSGTLELIGVRLESNRADGGGGLAQSGAGADLFAVGSTFHDNAASNLGGGIYIERGGALLLRNTYSENVASEGGGLYNQDPLAEGGQITVGNSTFYRNTGLNGGGGISNRDGFVSLDSSTFSENSLRAIESSGGTFISRNSIMANSLTSGGTPDADCALFGTGSILDLGNNVVENPGTCSFVHPGPRDPSQLNVDPMLGFFGDYGGTNKTIALLPGSVAIDTGDTVRSFDQRNVARPQLSDDDVGSFELESAISPEPPESFTMTMSAGAQNVSGHFERFSNRGPNFQVLIQQANGSLTPYAAPTAATYLGRVDEDSGALASAVYFPDGTVFYQVIFQDGTQWNNEGGTTTVRSEGEFNREWPQLVPGEAGAGGRIYGAEVGVDLPFHRYDGIHGSDTDEALAMIEHSIMSANLVYLKQVGIFHRLGRVILRGSQAQDPYAPFLVSLPPDCDRLCAFLEELSNQWEDVLPPTTHDLALVVNATSVAGLAYVGTVGAGAGRYSATDATAAGDFSRPWRHEAGHNWFLAHFDGGAPEGPTMNSNNVLGRMSGPEQAIVTSFRDDRMSFLDDLGALAIGIPPNAGTDHAYVPAYETSVDIDVLANDHDANGDGFSLEFVDENPLFGNLNGSMMLIPGAGPGGRAVLRYFPPIAVTPSSEIDYFEYRIRDSSGQESVGSVFARTVGFSNSYAQDFDSFADGTSDLGDGSIVSQVDEFPAGSVQQQSLELIPGVDQGFAGFTLPLIELQNGFSANFLLRLSTGTPPGGNGFALNLGQPIANRLGRYPSGFGEGLTVEFNTSPGNPGYRVLVDGDQLPNGFVSEPNLVDGLWHNVDVDWIGWQGFGRLTLSVDEVEIFSNLSTQSFAPEDLDLLSFSARSAVERHRAEIDDVNASRRSAPEPSFGLGLLVGLGVLTSRSRSFSRRNLGLG